MRIDIITIFPEYFTSPLKVGLIGKALEKGLIDIRVHNLRDFSNIKHRKIDDRPFGGGAGMVFMVEPLWNAVSRLKKKDTKVILFSPSGAILNDEFSDVLSRNKHFIFICPRYEGVDERVKNFIDYEISIGDYILNGGEVAALVLIEVLSRKIDGVIGNKDSLKEESFKNFLLEYPQYTQPREFLGNRVPEILLSGDHKKIEEWRMLKRKEITEKKRPDLFLRYLERKIKKRLK